MRFHFRPVQCYADYFVSIYLLLFFLLIARFKIKYHPEESIKRKDEQVSALKVNTKMYNATSTSHFAILFDRQRETEKNYFIFQKRVQVFLDLLKSGEIDKVSVDADQADVLLRLLDAVVIKLEGGTEEDLQILNVKPLKPFITKDTSKEKEDNKGKPIEKKPESRYCI